MKRLRILLLVASYFLFPPLTHATSFKLSPSSGTYHQQCQYHLDIVLDTGSSSTNAADVFIEYDPYKIEVLDSDPLTTGTQIKTGNVFGSYFGNVVDKSSGSIRLTGASFSGTFQGSGVFGSINFRPLLNNANAAFTIRFTGVGPYVSLDSNIANPTTSYDTLTAVENAFFAMDSGQCTTDSTPPTITFIAPTHQQTGVPPAANILIDVSDSDSGVNLTATSFVVNGLTYRPTDSTVTVTGNSALYHFTIHPLDPLFFNSPNTLLVYATDLKGNSHHSFIIFNQPPPLIAPPIPAPTCPVSPICPLCPNLTTSTPAPTPTAIDSDSPLIKFIRPLNKDLISTTPKIIFQVSDSGHGVDSSTLKVTLGQQTYISSHPHLKFTGSPSSYQVELQVTSPLTPSSSQTLTVFVSDLAGNGLSQSLYLTTKTPFLSRLSRFTTLTFTLVRSLFPLLSFLALLATLYFLLVGYLHRSPPRNLQPFGLVFDRDTLEPLHRIKINIYQSSGKLFTTARSNIYGIFAAKLPPGRYRLLVSHPNFISATSENLILNINSSTPRPFQNISLPRRLPDLHPTPKYGLVTDSQHQPLANITLELFSLDHPFTVTTRRTDSSGHYRFLVPHGHYRLSSPDHILSSDLIIDTRYLIDGYTTINQNLIVLNKP